MAVSVNDIVRVTAVMAGPSGRIENVYNFKVDSLVLGEDVQIMTDLAQKLDDAYDHLGAALTSDTIFVEVQGFDLTQDRPLPTVTWPTQTVGSGGADSYAAQVSLLGLLRTGVARVLGRKFIGGLATGITDTNGFVTSAGMTLMGAFLAELVGTFISTSLNSYTPGVKSKTSGLFHAFIEGVASGVPAVQRRRRQGRGI